MHQEGLSSMSLIVLRHPHNTISMAKTELFNFKLSWDLIVFSEHGKPQLVFERCSENMVVIQEND